MAILSVDLAFRSWADLGIVVLDRNQPEPTVPSAQNEESSRIRPLSDNRRQTLSQPTIHCEVILFNSPDERPGPVDANVLAGQLNHLCTVRGIQVILLDGPQAWKSRFNGLEHSRVSERQLNTAAKTGLPGVVKPATYRAFAEFCLDVYDGLCRRGWRRLETRAQPSSAPERILVESYPHAAWKSLGLKPLPSKRLARVSDLAEAYAALNSMIPLSTNRPPNHDQLQAIVGGLPGLALEGRSSLGARIVGEPPRREEGHWREGFIVLPISPMTPPSVILPRNSHRSE